MSREGWGTWPEAPFVGREEELGQLLCALGKARSGRGRLILLGGEAGVGKSRLLRALEQAAEPTDARVCRAGSSDGRGAPPYRPWVQVLGDVLVDTPHDLVSARLGVAAADLERLLARPAEPTVPLPWFGDDEPAGVRLRLFESVTAFLRAASAEAPLVLAFDDLHAADEASLKLLLHLAEELPESGLLVVGTYREEEVRSSPRLHRLVAALGRHGRRLVVAGLGEEEVAVVLEHWGLLSDGSDLARRVHDATDGNPFFVQMVARALAGRSAGDDAEVDPVPDEVHRAVRLCLERLRPEARCALRRVAVLGTTFDGATLELMAAEPGALPAGILPEAAAWGVVDEAAPGCWAFSHGLVRETLYEELRLSERVELHGRAGRLLEQRRVDGQAVEASELAHHHVEAARAGDTSGAARWCAQAADEAMDALAFEDAARWYARALEALALAPPVDERHRFVLLSSLARARLGEGERAEAREACQRALKAARAAGTPDLLARGALDLASLGEGPGDAAAASALEEACVALPEGDTWLRAGVLLALARARVPDWRATRELSDRGVAMARRLRDRNVLARALLRWHDANLGPDSLAERVAVAGEFMSLAAEDGDERLLAAARHRHISVLLEAGDVEGVVDELSHASREAAELRLPSLRWSVATRQAALALLQGRLGDAEDLARQALALGERGGISSADAVFTAQLMVVRGEQGRFAEVAELAGRVPRARAGGSAYEAATALALARSGATDRASELLARVTTDHEAWADLAHPALVAEASWELNEDRWAAGLHDALAPHAGRHVLFEPGGTSLGAVDRYVGMLAALLGRADEADSRFEAAHRLHVRLGAPGWLAHGQADHARALLRAARPGDATRATQLARAAMAAYRCLGMAFFAEQVGELAPGPVGGPVLSPQLVVFRREGEFWAVGQGGECLRLRDGKGPRYLARLLADPGREFHALDLVIGGSGPGMSSRPDRELVASAGGDAGAVLDERAKAAYKRRLAELREEIDDATAANDLVRADRAQEEIDFLVAELSAAVGLGGRDRKAASDAERARQSVTRAVRSSIERIAAADAALGAHLQTAVRTGTYCCYQPDPRARIVWET